jgi:hypothetical protein
MQPLPQMNPGRAEYPVWYSVLLHFCSDLRSESAAVEKSLIGTGQLELLFADDRTADILLVGRKSLDIRTDNQRDLSAAAERPTSSCTSDLGSAIQGGRNRAVDSEASGTRSSLGRIQSGPE